MNHNRRVDFCFGVQRCGECKISFASFSIFIVRLSFETSKVKFGNQDLANL
jgi:hypothetical protein